MIFSLTRRAAVLAATFALASCASWQHSGVTDIHLVALNDFHGNLEASKFKYTPAGQTEELSVTAGGIDTLGAALQAWRKEDDQLLVVGAGDLVGGSPAMSSMWADEPTIGAMNRLGLRVSAVGNHEFDGGRAELMRQQKGGCASPRPEKACKLEPTFGGAQFSYLAANVFDMVTNQPFLPAYSIEEVHGIKVGFIGAVLKDTADMSLASGIAGLRFADEADSINRVLPELHRQGVDVFVVLIHQGGRTVDQFDQPDCAHLTGDIVDIVKRLDPAIRLVISGHSHKGYLCKVDGRVVTQSEKEGHLLGRITVSVDNATHAVRDISARNVVMVPGVYAPAPELDAYLASVRARSDAVLTRPIAHLAVNKVERGKDLPIESALGELVADGMLRAGRPFGAQIAFQNRGGVRGDLEVNADRTATIGQLQKVLPFANTLVVMNLTGAQIRALLEQQWLDGRGETRGLLQVSNGFRYAWDDSRPEGQKVLPDSVTLNGAPLVDDSSYRVATNNFLAEGGDYFPVFKQGGNRARTDLRDIDMLSAYLLACEQAGKPAGAAAPAGRITRVDQAHADQP
ncbi:bifunctional metallophosphatase/5'-nucleotidase [Rugamonas sp.]|uniref:bifunctional metallophosphatase/5'-nucleotidase n=1 Tax=Rugamonas sp. TaxID=1926287 RepID=UPI0025E2F3AC|nr:bifunctional metallophosphatase/5'-nucleotidase [Rugamonas sp.]